VDHQRTLAPNAGLRAEQLVDLVVERETAPGEVELGARLLVAAEDVALPEPGGLGGRLSRAFEQADVDSSARELPRRGAADDPGADDRDLE
jgi:hypothetical protein